jgi:glutamate racemase
MAATSMKEDGKVAVIATRATVERGQDGPDILEPELDAEALFLRIIRQRSLTFS